MVTPHHTMSTDDVPARERGVYWRDWVDRLFRGLDSDCYGDSTFDGHMRTTRAGDVLLTRLEANRHRVARSAAQAAAPCGDSEEGLLKIVAPLWGSACVHQQGRRSEVRPGQWSIYDTTDPYVVENPSRVEHLIVMLPKAPFARRGPALSHLMARTLGDGGQGGNGAIARLALSTLRTAYHELPDMNDHTARSVGDTLVQLVNLALLDLDGTPTSAGQKAQLLERIKHHIAARLGDPALSVDSIAATLSCSRRQLYNAFTDEPDGVAGYILHQRLLAARRGLESSAQPPRTITEVALDCGFTSLAHFSRVFRSRVGVAPGEYRRGVRPGFAP